MAHLYLIAILFCNSDVEYVTSLRLPGGFWVFDNPPDAES